MRVVCKSLFFLFLTTTINQHLITGCQQFLAHFETSILMSHYNHSLSVNDAITASTNCPNNFEHVIIFVAKIGYYSNMLISVPKEELGYIHQYPLLRKKICLVTRQKGPSSSSQYSQTPNMWPPSGK